MQKKGIFATTMFTLFLLGCLTVSCSADLVPMTINEMAEKADTILIGKVESVLHCPATFEDIPHMHRK